MRNESSITDNAAPTAMSLPAEATYSHSLPHFFAPLWGPLVAMAVFLVHCVIFYNRRERPDFPNYAWGHLPLDDAWIHLSYVRHLLEHGYFTYNPGEIETGATSPLWVLVLAAVMAVVRGPVLAAKVAGMACGAACVGLAFSELRHAAGRAAAWTGALALALDPMWIMSCGAGMEIPLAGLLLVALIREVRLGRSLRAGLVMGLAFLARPDAAPCAAVAWLLLVWKGRGECGMRNAECGIKPIPHSAFRIPHFRLPLLAAAVAVAVVLPWLLYCRLGTGHWLPCTFYVKGQSNFHLGWEKFKVFVSTIEHGIYPSPLVHDPVALVLIALGIGFAIHAALRRRPATAAWLLLPVAHVAAWALLNPIEKINAHPGQYLSYVFTRYTIPDYPLVFGLLGLGAGVLARGLGWLNARLRTDLAPRADRALRRAMAVIVALTLVAGNFIGWWTYMGNLWLMGDSYRGIWRATAVLNQAACRNIYEIHERMARWVAGNVPAQTVIATQDAGAIRYFTRHRLIDLWGLNSHEYLFAPDKAEYLRKQGVKVVVRFEPGRLDPLFDFKPGPTLSVFQTRIPNKISEGDIMVVREIE